MHINKLFMTDLEEGAPPVPKVTFITLDNEELTTLVETTVLATEPDDSGQRTVILVSDDPDALTERIKDIIRGYIPHLEDFTFDWRG